MPRVNAPLLSFGASGQIAQTQVYATWKGQPYVRRYVIPANPRSAEQTSTRSVFTWLNRVWRIAPSDFVAPWQAAVQSRRMIDRNLFIQQNLPLLRPGTDLTGMIMSPGAKGGLTGGITITPGNDQLTFAGTAPSPLPSGWTIVKMVGAAILQQDPHIDEDYEIFTVSDSSDPYSVVMSGLGSVSTYVAAGWWVFQRSASATDLAYGAAIGAEYITT
jgi:hypothetical protein